MTYLMTFLVTNLACFLLKIGAAPNFRPSFHFFNWQTAAIGTVLSGATMFFVDGMYASACVGLLMVIFLLIHYSTPPKPWGDVSQSLIVSKNKPKLHSVLTNFLLFSTTKSASIFCGFVKNTSNSGDRKFFYSLTTLVDNINSFSSATL
jgi:hypothetical protein